MPFPPDDFPTDTHRSLANRADLSLTIHVFYREVTIAIVRFKSYPRCLFPTTPSPVSVFWISFPPSLCFSPFTVRLFCLLCSMWVVGDASRPVKLEAEAHGPVFTRNLCAENCMWLSRSDVYITVCIFLCTLSQVTQTLWKCVWRFLLTTLRHRHRNRLSVSVTCAALLGPESGAVPTSDPSACHTLTNNFMNERSHRTLRCPLLSKARFWSSECNGRSRVVVSPNWNSLHRHIRSTFNWCLLCELLFFLGRFGDPNSKKGVWNKLALLNYSMYIYLSS